MHCLRENRCLCWFCNFYSSAQEEAFGRKLRMVSLGGSLIFKLLCPHELCTGGLSGPPFVSLVLGRVFNKQLLGMGWWGIIKQTNSLLMSQARRRFQAWMNYSSSLLGTLIMNCCLCSQDLARLSEINPFFNFIFVHSFFHSDGIFFKRAFIILTAAWWSIQKCQRGVWQNVSESSTVFAVLHSE